ncbi:MAG: hypothetical protein EZS28_003760 [Streblomastix strix]|uniref:Uncharacterized protein n=1 Tax=Streblomastix strix TaxID=222440 RepID=A0A5J4X0K6_9EUKA|nr:MAG: hypothetical protein EZS28_003760 [Streblomastix strix]
MLQFLTLAGGYESNNFTLMTSFYLFQLEKKELEVYFEDDEDDDEDEDEEEDDVYSSDAVVLSVQSLDLAYFLELISELCTL